MKHLETVKDMVEKTALRDGSLAPVIFFHGSKATSVLGLAEIPDPDTRHEMMFDVGARLADEHLEELGMPEEVFFVSEGWMSKAKKTVSGGQRPSEDPRRIECAIIAAAQLVPPDPMTTEIYVYEMKRDKKGELRSLDLMSPGGDVRGDAPILKAFLAGYLQSYLKQTSGSKPRRKKPEAS